MNLRPELRLFVIMAPKPVNTENNLKQNTLNFEEDDQKALYCSSEAQGI